jgi:hypothetical protein
MRRWIKYAIEIDGVKKYFSTAHWRDRGHVGSTGSDIQQASVDRYEVYAEYISKYIPTQSSILSIGSGYAFNEIKLHRSGYSITCTDSDRSIVDYMHRHEPNLPYELYDPTERPFHRKTAAIIAFSIFFYFDSETLTNVFKHVHESVTAGGVLVIDPGGGPNGLITRVLDLIQKIEILCTYVYLWIRLKKPKLVVKSNGYRTTDIEIIRAATAAGFTLKEVAHFDTFTELGKRTWLGRTLMKYHFFKKILMKLGTQVPYVRMMVFVA